MYTVILYRNGNDVTAKVDKEQREDIPNTGNLIDLDKYRFLFASMEQDDKLVLYKEKNDNLGEKQECADKLEENEEQIDKSTKEQESTDKSSDKEKIKGEQEKSGKEHEQIIENKESISKKIKDLIHKIDLIVGTHYIWKLLIFDGREGLSVDGDKLQMEELEFWQLIKFYLKGYKGADEECCESYPEEIWYMGWMEKEHIPQKPIKIEIPALEIHKLSVFCIPVDIDSKMDRRYSALMISCGLLILAINQFPIGFLRHKHLYFVNLEIDRKKFVEYVCFIHKILDEIKVLQKREQMNLQECRKQNFSYPDRTLKSISSTLPKHEEPPNIEKLKKRITRQQSPGNVEYALGKNAYEIRSWMYYPKGIMSDTVNRISEELDKEQRKDLLVGGFLSAEGKDKLEREKRASLEKFSVKKKILIDQKDFEYGFRREEDRVKKRARKQIKGLQRILLYLLLAIAEASFVFFMFAIKCIDDTSQIEPFSGSLQDFLKVPLMIKPVENSNDSHLVKGFLNGLEVFLRMPVIGKSSANFYLTAIIGGVFCFLATPVLLWVSSLFFWWYAKWHYGIYLKKNMVKKTEEKDKYLSDMLDLVAEYQYCIRIDKEQVELMDQWERRRKNLTKHDYIYHNSDLVVQKLRYLLDEDELMYPEDIVPENIDFMEEPQEVSYYWLPYKNTNCKTELNTSGYMLDGMLSFIHRFWCTEDPWHIV